MATASRVKVGRNGHSRVGPDLIRHPFAGLVGGPVKRPWREGTLTRAAELEALSAWMLGKYRANGNSRRADDAQVLGDAIARHLKAARDATNGRRYFSHDGSRLQRAMSNIDAAEAALLNLAPEEYLLGQMPGLLNHVQRHLRPTDPRRREMERIAQRVGMTNADHPSAHAAAKTPAAKKNEIANQRGTIVTAVRGASSTALREQTQVRSFYFVLMAVTGVMTCAAIGLGVMAWRSPSTIPLCFEPTTADETIVVCPTGQSRPFPAQQDGTTPPQDVDDAIKATVSPSDMVLVEVIGRPPPRWRPPPPFGDTRFVRAIWRTDGPRRPQAPHGSDHGRPGTATHPRRVHPRPQRTRLIPPDRLVGNCVRLRPTAVHTVR